MLRTLFSLLGLGQEGLFHSMFFSFDQLNNSGTVDVKKLSLSLSKNSLFKLGFSFSPRPAWGYYVVSGKNWLQKKWSLDSFYKVFFLRLPFVSINLLFDLAGNTVVMSGLLLLIATLINWISYRNRHVGLFVLHFILLVNSCLIIKILQAKAFTICITLVDDNQNWLNWFQFLILVGGPLFIIIDSLIFSFLFLDVNRMSMLTVSFLLQPFWGFSK